MVGTMAEMCIGEVRKREREREKEEEEEQQQRKRKFCRVVDFVHVVCECTDHQSSQIYKGRNLVLFGVIFISTT